MAGTATTSWISTDSSNFTYARWNSGDKSSKLILSGSDLIAQSSVGGAFDYQVRTNISKSSGKWYFESTFTRNVGSDPFFVMGGLSNPSESVDKYTGFSSGVCATTDGNTYDNNTFNTTGWGAWTDGQIAGWAWDATAGTLQLYRNNVLLGQVGNAHTGNMLFGTGTFQTLGTSTFNFGATAFTYTPPTGYNRGLYV